MPATIVRTPAAQLPLIRDALGERSPCIPVDLRHRASQQSGKRLTSTEKHVIEKASLAPLSHLSEFRTFLRVLKLRALSGHPARATGAQSRSPCFVRLLNLPPYKYITHLQGDISTTTSASTESNSSSIESPRRPFSYPFASIPLGPYLRGQRYQTFTSPLASPPLEGFE